MIKSPYKIIPILCCLGLVALIWTCDELMFARVFGSLAWIVILFCVLVAKVNNRSKARRWWITIYPEAGIPNSIHTCWQFAQMTLIEKNNTGPRTDLGMVEVQEVK